MNGQQHAGLPATQLPEPPQLRDRRRDRLHFSCLYAALRSSPFYSCQAHQHRPSHTSGFKAISISAGEGDRDSTSPTAEHEEPVYLLGIPMHKLSRSIQFAVCSFGTMFFYLLYGYSQEWIFSEEDFRLFGWYLTLVQFVYYSLFGLVERRLKGESCRRIPMATYLLLAFLTVATMGLANSSLAYLNYPTQVLFKSCKLIPVMLFGALIQGKRYSFLHLTSMLLMCLGLLLFHLAEFSVRAKPDMNQTGLVLVSLSLCADAVIGNVQERAMKEHSASGVELILYSHTIGVLYILVGVLLSGSFLPAFLYCLENPRIYLMAAVFSLTGYLGVNFVLALIGSFGVLTAVTVTTLRKALTMVLSFIIFTKPFTQQYLWAGLIVLLGIVLNVYCKNSSVRQWTDVLWLRLYYSLRRGKRTSTPELLVV